MLVGDSNPHHIRFFLSILTQSCLPLTTYTHIIKMAFDGVRVMFIPMILEFHWVVGLFIGA